MAPWQCTSLLSRRDLVFSYPLQWGFAIIKELWFSYPYHRVALEPLVWRVATLSCAGWIQAGARARVYLRQINHALREKSEKHSAKSLST